ncbi:MAG TPA: extracellular solute-binding protein [Xanthobacteraceae bacterium]|nr:extracellular solute-binding protein [Xanthobacteraceae bacterium]
MMPRRGIAAWAIAIAALAAGAAAAQGRLVVYSANDANLNRFVFEAFSRETGIAVEPVEAGSGVIFRRIASEREHPLGDAVWGVSRALLAANRALLAPYGSTNKDAVPAEFRDPEDRWIGTNVHLLVILQNTTLVAADAGPKTWADLIDAQWKGRIAFTDPANSGSAYTNLTMLADLWGGGDAGWDKVGELLANTKVLNRSTLVFQGVGNGEFALGMSLEYAGLLWAANGAPIKVVYPRDGTVAQMEGVGVIKGGPNPQAAQAFVDFVSRKDVREAILRFAFRRPARQDLDLDKLPGQMPALADVKLVPYDEDGWGARRAETLQKIQDLVRRTR